MNKRGQVQESSQEGADERKKKLIFYILIGIVAVLVIAIAVVLIIIMTGEEKPAVSEEETAGAEAPIDVQGSLDISEVNIDDYTIVNESECLVHQDCENIYGVGYVCVSGQCYSGGGGSGGGSSGGGAEGESAGTTTTTGEAGGPGPGIFQHFKSA